MNAKIPITKLPENRHWTQMPTGPRERRISIHVLGVNRRASVQQKLDGLFVAESSRAVKWRLAFGAHVPHETAGLNGFLCYTIRIRAMGEQDPQHQVVGQTFRCTKRRM